MELRTWWRPVLVMLCIAIASCSEEPTASAPLTDTPQWSHAGDRPDLNGVAKFQQGDRPRKEQARALIGAEGGRVSLDGFEIIVPAGAVDQPTNFWIRIPRSQDGADYVIAEFSPHQQFNVPVTIRLPQSGTDAEDGSHVAWWSGSEWVPLATLKRADGRIEAEVWHFSYYATRRGIILTGG